LTTCRRSSGFDGLLNCRDENRVESEWSDGSAGSLKIFWLGQKLFGVCNAELSSPGQDTNKLWSSIGTSRFTSTTGSRPCAYGSRGFLFGLSPGHVATRRVTWKKKRVLVADATFKRSLTFVIVMVQTYKPLTQLFQALVASLRPHVRVFNQLRSAVEQVIEVDGVSRELSNCNRGRSSSRFDGSSFAPSCDKEDVSLIESAQELVFSFLECYSFALLLQPSIAIYILFTLSQTCHPFHHIFLSSQS
jgi:hypothetical protein